MWSVIFLCRMLAKWIGSQGLGLQFTNLPTLMVNLCSSFAFHTLPQTDICLFSPQTYHQIHGEYLEVYRQSIQMKLCTSTISIDIVQDLTKLPIVHDSYVSEKAERGLWSQMQSGLCQTHLSALDFFGEINSVVSSIVTQPEQSFFPCFLCVWFREWQTVIPSEGATFVALETWYKYVLGPGTHAWADAWKIFWQTHCFASYNQTTIPFCLELCYSGMSVLPPSLGQEAHSQWEAKQCFTWEWGSPISC